MFKLKAESIFYKKISRCMPNICRIHKQDTLANPLRLYFMSRDANLCIYLFFNKGKSFRIKIENKLM